MTAMVSAVNKEKDDSVNFLFVSKSQSEFVPSCRDHIHSRFSNLSTQMPSIVSSVKTSVQMME